MTITLYNENGLKIKDISDFEYNEADMGESSITATILFDGVMKFHPDWYVEYMGEKFRLGVRKPTGKDDTSSLSASYTLVFKSEIEDLKRFTFMDYTELGTKNPQPVSSKVYLYATLTEFVDRFNLNLKYNFGDRWKMVLPAGYVDSGKAILVSFENASIWDVLVQVYSLYGVRWRTDGSSGVMKILVAHDPVEIEHIFERGANKGLVSIERNNELERIITRLRGLGSERNLPFHYFHKGDPDANENLKGVYYPRLLPKVYRDYVRGYNAGSGTGTWAYNKGVEDKVAGRPIAPVDYVISDKENLWGVSYGAIEANDEIYPTIQGAERAGLGRLDEVVDVEKVYVDSPEDSAAPDKTTISDLVYDAMAYADDQDGYYGVPSCFKPVNLITKTESFHIGVESNSVDFELKVEMGVKDWIGNELTYPDFDAPDTKLTVFIPVIVNGPSSSTPILINKPGTYKISLSNLKPGDYYISTNGYWSASRDTKYKKHFICTKYSMYGVSIKQYPTEQQKLSANFKETFEIWIKDVWNIPRNSGESDADYAYRVWSPLAVSDEMTVMFSDGLLAGEDYEFRVVGFSKDSKNLGEIIRNAIHPDTSKTTADGKRSAWRLQLEKSEAEREASGKYLPNQMINAKPGDHFFFIHIAMPYDPYVYDAEKRLEAYLDEELALKEDEFPSFTITPSKIFCDGFAEGSKIRAGSKVRIRNRRLIGESYTVLTIQSLVKRYTGTSLMPEWQVTVSDQVVASGNPIEVLSGSVNALAAQVYSNKEAVREAIKQLSSTFLRKDGVADTSFSETNFEERVTLSSSLEDKDFKRGDATGQGFGIYTDGDGNRVIEADYIVARMGARFKEIITSQAKHTGGMNIISAAGIVLSKVEMVDGNYRCYFDTKGASVFNLFEADDNAYCYTTSGGVRSYWRRVVAIGPDWIDLSDQIKAAESAVPAVGDNVIQLGNSSNAKRQSAIIESTTEDTSPSITLLSGISGFTLKDKAIVSIQKDPTTNEPKFFCYGDMWLGDKPGTGNQYINYRKGADGKRILDINGALLSDLVAVTDENDNIVAGMNGNDKYKVNDDEGNLNKVMMVAGIPATTESGSTNIEDRIKEASTKITENGLIDTRMLVAREGAKIGIFSVDSNGAFRSVDANQLVSISKLDILFKEFGFLRNCQFGLLKVTIPGEHGGGTGSQAGLHIEDTSVVGVDKSGIVLDISGGNRNFAICAKHGQTAGLRPKLRAITSWKDNMNLSTIDHTIILSLKKDSSHQGPAVINLPGSYADSPEDGQEYVIIKASNDADLVIRSSVADIFVPNGSFLNTQYPVPANFGGEIKLVFSRDLGVWVLVKRSTES